jgi:hypothetical protein
VLDFSPSLIHGAHFFFVAVGRAMGSVTHSTVLLELHGHRAVTDPAFSECASACLAVSRRFRAVACGSAVMQLKFTPRRI